MSQFTECGDCQEHEHVTIRALYQGHGENVFLVKCDHCNTKLVPVVVPYFATQGEVSERCMAAWNAALVAAPVAARDVLAERLRQQTVEGWAPAHDDCHNNGELADAAACYALNAAVPLGRLKPRYWPWDSAWWRPTTPRRDLVKAGALILAEIERLDRAACTPQPADQPTDQPAA